MELLIGAIILWVVPMYICYEQSVSTLSHAHP